MRNPLTGWRGAGAALAWLAGVALQLRQADLWPIAAYLALGLAAGLSGGLLVWFVRQPAAKPGGRGVSDDAVIGQGVARAPLPAAAHWQARARLVLLLLSCALLGHASAGVQGALRWAQSLPTELEGVDLQVTGLVSSLPRQRGNGLQFLFNVETARLPGLGPIVLPSTLSLGWYPGWGHDAVMTSLQRELRAGQRWQFTVRLRQPHGLSNPHGHDHELHLFERGVRATGQVREQSAELLDRRAGHPVERIRQHVRDGIDAVVAEPGPAGVLAGLAIGDQAAIEREDWDLFRITGITHLVAISGLHVTMFAWMAAALIRMAWRRSTRAMLWVPAPRAAQWGGLMAATAYAVLSGWGVPAQRTVWMLAIVTLLQTGARRWPWPLVLLTAAVVVTALDPWALLQPGFWLSFCAVGLLMASSDEHAAWMQSAELPAGWRKPWQRLRAAVAGGLRTQLTATVGLAPLTMIFFQQLSLVSFLANLVAIPLVSFVITPLALLGIVAAPLWSLGADIVVVSMRGLQWLANWPSAVWPAPVAPWWAQIAGLVAAVLAVLPLPLRLRLLVWPLMLPLLWPPRDLPPEGEFQVVAVDVGQGTAVLVRTREHLLVYDAGPQYSLDSDAGQRTLLPLLRATGDARIHRLVLSHRDADHVGGASALLGQWPVDDMLSSIERLHPLQWQAAARGVPSRRCHAGQSWAWDGVQFDVLHPLADDYERALRSNAMSCVVRVHNARTSVLLTGDVERAGELALVARHGDDLRSDVLLVPHHGSRTSSTDPFLDAVQPRVAVVQAGHRNRFGHPASDVLARYERRNVPVLQSASCGAWSMSSTDSDTALLGQCHRPRQRRYWHHHGLR